jgi:hypothetical protein
VRWTAISPAKSVTTLDDFGELHDLSELRQGRGLEFRPYIRVTNRDQAVPRDRGFLFDSGFDVTYRITPSLTAVGTFRTDFAESEVDERVVSLSRFPTFFPEKRDFFLQDAQVFAFGGLTETDRPYFSRRIGLGADGLPVTILGGLRLTGRIGGTSVALLDVEQAEHNGIEMKNLAIARVSQQLSHDWSAGMIATNGDPFANSGATLAGLDFNFQHNLPNEKRLIAHGFVMGSSSELLGDDAAFGADIDYPNEPLGVHLTFRQWGEHFEMPLGFLERNGIRRYIASVLYTWRPNTAWIRSVSVQALPIYATDLNNRVVEENSDLPFVILTSSSLDVLGVGYALTRDFVDEPFELLPGIVVPPRNYRQPFFQGYFTSSEARSVGVGLFVRRGDYYGGTRDDYSAEVKWRPSRFLTAGAYYNLRQIRLKEGSFDVRIIKAHLNVAFTPDLTWNTLIQYDNVSREVGLNSRLRWTWRPGHDLFLVLNQGWDYETGRLTKSNRDLTIKAAATIRF